MLVFGLVIHGFVCMSLLVHVRASECVHASVNRLCMYAY